MRVEEETDAGPRKGLQAVRLHGGLGTIIAAFSVCTWGRAVISCVHVTAPLNGEKAVYDCCES